MIADAAAHRELEPVQLAVSEEERAFVAKAAEREFVRGVGPPLLARKRVADPRRLRERVRVGSIEQHAHVAVCENAGRFRLEKEKSVAEKKLIADRQRREQVLRIRRRGKTEEEREGRSSHNARNHIIAGTPR